MDTLYDLEPKNTTKKARRKRSRKPVTPWHLQEYRGKLVVDRFVPDAMLRIARPDIKAEPGLDIWIAFKRLVNLLEHDNAPSTARFEPELNKVVRDFPHARLPLHHQPALALPPGNAWDPMDQVAWALDHDEPIALSRASELLRWARRFLDRKDTDGLRIDMNGLARIHDVALGPVYQAMPGWPALSLCHAHLGLLFELLRSEQSTKQAMTEYKPADALQVVQATIGESRTPYWFFYAIPTPSFLAVRCRNTTASPVFQMPERGKRLLVVNQDLLVDVCRMIIRPWAANAVELAIETNASEHLLHIGTPDLTGARTAIPIEHGIESLRSLRVPQGSFCRSVAAAMSPCKRIGLYLNPDQSRLQIASVNPAEMPDFQDGTFDNHVPRTAEVGIQQLELGEVEQVPATGVILKETP